MILRRCRPIILAVLLTSSAATAQPTTPDDYAELGKAAFEAKRYKDAWNAYRTAFQLDPIPIRASQVAIAAPYADRMSTAIGDLKQWLVLKRRDAQRKGDQEESWATLESIVNAYQANARRSETVVTTQETEVERLKQQVKLLKDSVRRLEIEKQQLKSQLPD